MTTVQARKHGRTEANTRGAARRPRTAARAGASGDGSPAIRRPDAVLLLARGGYGDWPQQELDRMVAAVRAAGRYRHVDDVFIDQGTPYLPAALQACVDAGARRVLVQPVFVPVDRSLRIWIPRVIRRWLRRAGRDVEVVLAGPIGDHPALGAAVARAVLDAEAGDDVRVEARTKDDLGSPGWAVIPAHKYDALFCTGPRCATQGALDLYQYLRDRLLERKLVDGKDGVRLARTGCLYPCNLGPVMVVYPEGAWYCALTPRALDRILDEHFAGGRVVEAYTRKPGRQRHTRPQPATGGAARGEDAEARAAAERAYVAVAV